MEGGVCDMGPDLLYSSIQQHGPALAVQGALSVSEKENALQRRETEKQKPRQNKIYHSWCTAKEAQEMRYLHMRSKGEAESEKQSKIKVQGGKEAANPSHYHPVTLLC